MANGFEFILNGRSICVEDVSPNVTLLEFLRTRGLTGAKEGCAEGDCGACSVALRNSDADRQPGYRVINSCLVPLPTMAGRELVTVEGVADGGLHPVQRAMVERHGSQCGYCTPGIVCSLFEAYHRGDLREEWQLDDQLCGNLCRCTGYRAIVEAARAALPSPSERRVLRVHENQAGSEHLELSPPKESESAPAMEYEAHGEQFLRPGSLEELFKLLRRFPDARLVAGATELGLDLTKRYKKFPLLVSLEGVPELTTIRQTRDAWHIGAAATLTAIEDTVAPEYPALHTMLRLFGSRQIRNRATMGGNLATASPIGDCAPVLIALDARVGILGRGPRELGLDKFFTGYRKTALLPREILGKVIVPRGAVPSGTKRFSAFYKVSKRREMDIATVSACFVVDVDKNGEVRYVRLAYGGVAPTPTRARRAEATLMGRVWNERNRAKTLEALANEFTPISDVRGSMEYRRELIVSLFKKFVEETKDSGETVSNNRAKRNLPLTPALSPADGEREEQTQSLDESNRVALADTRPTILPRPRRWGEGRGEGESVAEPSSSPHESAHLHVTGGALYVDDQTVGAGMLEVWPVCSPHAHARIVRRDTAAVLAMPGVHAVLLAGDIPGLNDVGVVRHDEPLLATDEVFFHGQIVALVVGETPEACRLAAEKVVVEYEPLPAIFTIEQAIAANSFHTEPNFIRRGDAARGFAGAPHQLEGELACGGQDHFYLETQAAWARREEDGTMFVSSSTQHPSEVQGVVAHVLHLAANKVVVQCPRMGGGFGGKETQAATPAALAALAAWKTARPVRVRWNRDQDMMLTGKRHPFFARFKAGFDANGLLLALQAELFSNGGWSLDLSTAVTDRALFHIDNAYFIPHVEVSGRVAKTHLVSNTAFRGFGGPQGMLVIEEILDRVARRLGLPPEVVRERNLYRGSGEMNTTHYGQQIEDNRLQTIWHELKSWSRFDERRREIAAWNSSHAGRKRGLAVTPVKFGISFTVTHLNQAGASVLIYQDGSVQVNHGGTEMGQGIHTNIRAIAARELGLPPEKIRVMPTSTDKVPNTSATAASAGTDLNGAAVKAACVTLVSRLRPVAARLLAGRGVSAASPDALTFCDGSVVDPENPDVRVPFAEVVLKAYLDRVSLSAAGHYATPGISWDRATGMGRPFHYFADGAAVTEVEVDGFTGMFEVLRADILQDCGDSINAGVNRGQIEGGFVQGMGWLTGEELKWDDQGRLLTHSPDTYKIPSVGDRPREFNVRFLERAAQENVIHGSKAVGEPPLMLAISVREAIRDAIAAFGASGGEILLPSPATSEATFSAIQKRSSAVPEPPAPARRKRGVIAR